MAEIRKQVKYANKMRLLGLKVITLWAHPTDHDKLRNTARLSRNRVMRSK